MAQYDPKTEIIVYYFTVFLSECQILELIFLQHIAFQIDIFSTGRRWGGESPYWAEKLWQAIGGGEKMEFWICGVDKFKAPSYNRGNNTNL